MHKSSCSKQNTENRREKIRAAVSLERVCQQQFRVKTTFLQGLKKILVLKRKEQLLCFIVGWRFEIQFGSGATVEAEMAAAILAWLPCKTCGESLQLRPKSSQQPQMASPRIRSTSCPQIKLHQVTDREEKTASAPHVLKQFVVSWQQSKVSTLKTEKAAWMWLDCSPETKTSSAFYFSAGQVVVHTLMLIHSEERRYMVKINSNILVYLTCQREKWVFILQVIFSPCYLYI